ncbi:MAG: hypothetical protein AAF626_09180 [Pseudomonadota bacterium]
MTQNKMLLEGGEEIIADDPVYIALTPRLIDEKPGLLDDDKSKAYRVPMISGAPERADEQIGDDVVVPARASAQKTADFAQFTKTEVENICKSAA